MHYLVLYNIRRRTKSQAQRGQKNSMFGRNGGKHPRFGKKHTIKARKKMSNKKTGCNNPMYGSIRSDLTKKFVGIGNPFFGKHHTDKTRLALSGKAHHNWKGGITKLSNKIRALPEYLEWRKLCLKRDSYTCVFCQKTNITLNVDHIEQFAVVIKENNIKTISEAAGCAGLWKLSNGRTLCVECHKNTDTFGRQTT